jgi:hypothetical protein
MATSPSPQGALTNNEILELARYFRVKSRARSLLSEVGMEEEDQPEWHNSSPVEFWREATGYLSLAQQRELIAAVREVSASTKMLASQPS